MSDKIFRIKKYTILEKLEDSNYASIYKIEDQEHELRILKISRTSIRDNNDLIAREFRILSQFQHPHIVPVFHFDTHSDGRSYFITDFIPGLPIHEVLTSFSEKYATAMLQCIQALSAFHQKGFIHCDLKPEHIIYDQQQGKAVLIDFGFASAISDEPLHAGTFGYIAPEILKGLGIDQRSDLYSIGVIMYETLAGKRYTERFEDIKNVPDEINTLVHRLTSEEPSLRPTLPDVHKILLKYTPTTKITLPEYSVTLPHTAYIADAALNTNLQRGGDSTKIVVGTTGAGKSRTLQELKYQYLLADKTVVFHKATDPFTFPECLAQITGIDLSGIHEHDDKFQIFDMINTALHHAMKNKKLVILIDDIHEFSDYEMELFRYLGYGAEDTDMELIGSSMPDTRVTHLGFTQLQITPFSVAQTKDLLKKTFFKIDITGTPITEFASWLHSQSGGNPLFIREILKMLHDNAILCFANNRWVVESKKMEKIRVPESIEDMLVKSVKQLSDDSLHILKILASVEQALQSVIITEIERKDVDRYLEQLNNLGLIRDERAGQHRIIYIANDILISLINKMMTQKEKTLLRKKILKTIESMKNKEHYLSLITNLSHLTKQSTKAAKYALAAAAEARSINDYKSAIYYYSLALTDSSKAKNKGFSQLYLDLAETYRLIGENKRALAYYKKLLNVKSARFVHAANIGIGKTYTALGQHRKAIVFYKKALSYRTKRQDHAYGEIAQRLAYSYILLEDFKQARDILTSVLRLSETLKDKELFANTLYYQAVQKLQEQQVDESIHIAEKCSQYLRDKNLLKEQAYISNLLSTAYARKGEMEVAARCLDKAIIYFKQTKIIQALQSALFNKAYLLRKTGRLLLAKEIFQQLIVRARQVNNHLVIRSCLTERANILEYLGYFHEALSLHSEYLATNPADTTVACSIIIIWCKLGELRKAQDLLGKHFSDRTDPYFFIAVAHICVVRDDQKSAVKHIRDLQGVMNTAKLNTPTFHDIIFALIELCFSTNQYQQTLSYAQQLLPFLNQQSREYMVAKSYQQIAKLYLSRNNDFNVTRELTHLKEIGCHYDYVRVQHARIKVSLDLAIPSDDNDFAKILKETVLICESLHTEPELRYAQNLQRRIMQKVPNTSYKDESSQDYLATFSVIAEIINSKLGTADFSLHLLNAILQATGAERGALFIKTSSGRMEMVAGRHMDQNTIKDANELSRTAIEAMDRGTFVLTCDALSDPHFSTKRSVLLNKIRAILCLPLVISGDVVGALYLDSQHTTGIFSASDQQFLQTVSKIIASVIEKSSEYSALSKENILLQSTIIDSVGRGYLIGKSKAMKNVYQLIADVAQTDAPVLLIGETGTGKGMLARIIHMKSQRHQKRFQTINCGTITETLLESELFGHKKGSFTGAIHDKPGLLEEAEGGTIFLDEITNTSPAFQAKLLEAIEDKTIRRVGETVPRSINVRFLFATNKDLEIEVEENRFRKDLYYRINVFTINVPPLRERVADIPMLAKFFLEKSCTTIGKRISHFSSDAIKNLQAYHWPGNVRELQNVIERAVVIAKGHMITTKQLNVTHNLNGPIASIAHIKQEAVIEALSATNWNVSRAAKALGISRSSLHRYIKKFQLKR